MLHRLSPGSDALSIVLAFDWVVVELHNVVDSGLHNDCATNVKFDMKHHTCITNNILLVILHKG
jgi:hypothetical protein